MLHINRCADVFGKEISDKPNMNLQFSRKHTLTESYWPNIINFANACSLPALNFQECGDSIVGMWKEEMIVIFFIVLYAMSLIDR